jgi:hypothetical protein
MVRKKSDEPSGNVASDIEVASKAMDEAKKISNDPLTPVINLGQPFDPMAIIQEQMAQKHADFALNMVEKAANVSEIAKIESEERLRDAKRSSSRQPAARSSDGLPLPPGVEMGFDDEANSTAAVLEALSKLDVPDSEKLAFLEKNSATLLKGQPSDAGLDLLRPAKSGQAAAGGGSLSDMAAGLGALTNSISDAIKLGVAISNSSRPVQVPASSDSGTGGLEKMAAAIGKLAEAVVTGQKNLADKMDGVLSKSAEDNMKLREQLLRTEAAHTQEKLESNLKDMNARIEMLSKHNQQLLDVKGTIQRLNESGVKVTEKSPDILAAEREHELRRDELTHQWDMEDAERKERRLALIAQAQREKARGEALKVGTTVLGALVEGMMLKKNANDLGKGNGSKGAVALAGRVI